MQQLLVATKNAHKTREIAEILGPDWSVTDLTAHPEIDGAEETGETFPENAILKATHGSRLFDGLVLADDSGLEVDALGGAPGVRSARYAGEKASDEANRNKLLLALGDTAARTARFRCAMAIAHAGRLVGTCEGAVEGFILNEPRGTGGFGYDPLFVPEGFSETFAELPSATKNGLSHRGRALLKARDLLEEWHRKNAG